MLLMAVSTGRVDISPSDSLLPMAGYGMGVGEAARVPSHGTNAPLYARCTVFWDNGTPNVVVTADVLGISAAINAAVRTAVRDLGVADSDFMLTATHTHNGPALTDVLDPVFTYNATEDQVSRIAAYTSRLTDMLIDLVRTTLGTSRTACYLDFREAAAGFSYNREALAYVESVVPILTARDLQTDAPVAVMFGYGTHPVSAGPQRAWDPDYPGVAVDEVEHRLGCFAQFLLGPAGDQDPSGDRSFPSVTAHGQTLGQAVIDALSGGTGRRVAGPILNNYAVVALPLDITLTQANLTAVRADFGTRARRSTIGYEQRHAQYWSTNLSTDPANPNFDTTVNLPLQIWRFSGAETVLKLLGTGGELVSGYAVNLRTRYATPNTAVWVNGYTNEQPAYIPSDELLHSGGNHYACGWTVDYPGIGGGSLCIYNHVAHFRGRPLGTQTIGVEQLLLGEACALLDQR